MEMAFMAWHSWHGMAWLYGIHIHALWHSRQTNGLILARYKQAQLKLLPRVSYCTYRGKSGKCKW